MTKLEKDVLEYLNSHDSEATFYHVARRFGSSPQPDLPSIIAEFKNRGWIVEKNQDERAAFPLLQVTNKGRAALNGKE